MDLLLSYNYYVKEPHIFIENESNVEFVDFLTKGFFPFLNFIKFLIAFPLLLFVLSWFDSLKEFIENIIFLKIIQMGRKFTITIPLFFSVFYIGAGCTWYYNSGFLHTLLSFIEKLIHNVIFLVIFFLFFLTVYLLASEIKISPHKL